MTEMEQGQGAPVSSESGSSETIQAPDLHTEVDTLRATVQEQAAKIDQLISVLSAKEQPKPVPYEELVKNNIGEAIKVAVKETVKLESGELHKTLAKKSYDDRLEKEYPQVNSDKAFRDLTVQTMTELVQTGEYSKESPALAYRAAQIAAHKYKPKTVQPGVGGLTGEAPRSTAKTTQQTDPGFEHWMSAFGGMIKDKDGMRAKYEAHKRGKK